MQLLVLSRWYPYPATNGSKVRVFNLLAHLGRSHAVDLVSFHDPDDPPSGAAIDAMRVHCRRVYAVPYRVFQPGRLRAVAAFAAARPRSLVDSYSGEFAGVVRTLAAGTRYDAVMASQIDMAGYARAVDGAARVLEEVEVSIFREQWRRAAGWAARARKRLMWHKWRRFMAGVMRDFDLVTVVSPREADVLREIAPACPPPVVVPNGADLVRLSGQFVAPEPDTLVYTGALTYYVNHDAMDFWLREVWPRVVARRPAAKLRMAGRLEGTRVADLPAAANAVHVGHVDDVRPLVQGSWASIVPERVGGGTRIKLLESLALGTPVIATRWAADGVAVRDGEEILLADTPDALADATVRLLGDPALRARLSRQGRALIEAQHDWRAIGAALEARLEDAVRRRRSQP